MTGFVVGVLIVVALQGAIAAWEGLRVTQTELIEGCKANARRHPLNGLMARVEDIAGQ